MLRFTPLPALLICLAAGAEAPLSVGRPLPPLLDLLDAGAEGLVPKDPRDPAQVEACRLAWEQRVGGLKAEAMLRIRLPLNGARWPLLLAASQALRAQNPQVRLFLAWQAGAPACWDEGVWGAVEGGALSPEDLGPDPVQWRDRLARAQEQFPGRPWWLWLPADPGPLASALLGDGGHLVVPQGGPAARLARQMPEGGFELEGGVGDLSLRAASGPMRRWRFEGGEWREAEPPRDRHEVRVSGEAAYDVGALLAKVRALQLRSRAGLRSVIADLEVDLHMQGEQGLGWDLGYSFLAFEQAGAAEEWLQREVRFNGVKANLGPNLQLPIVEPRSALAAPVAISLNERFRYRDGGPAGPGRRLLRFEPVDADPTLPSGELLVEEASGAILEERSRREGLEGMAKSVQRTLVYGEVTPGLWRVVEVRSFERWALVRGMVQAQRRMRFSAFRVNPEDFETQRTAARRSRDTMMVQTLEGLRYYSPDGQGGRRAEERPRSSGRAIGAFLVIQPGAQLPVFPAAGLVYFDFDAFRKGIQLTALTAVVYNAASVFIPHLPGGFDLGAGGGFSLLTSTERPVENGELSDRDGVGRRSGNFHLELGHDLKAGFRFTAQGLFQHDHFNLGQEEYRTPGFALPPGGWTRELRGRLSWQHQGFQLSGFYGKGQRPEGNYGTVQDPQAVPEQGEFRRWGGKLGQDWEYRPGWWLHGGGGFQSGRAFDRFYSLDLGGRGADAQVPGMQPNAIAADRMGYAELGFIIPTGPRLRLSTTLTHARLRSLDDQKFYGFTGMGLSGDLPGFGWFTTFRVDLGIGLQSDIPGVRTVNGIISLLRVF